MSVRLGYATATMTDCSVDYNYGNLHLFVSNFVTRKYCGTATGTWTFGLRLSALQIEILICQKCT